jgi:hypothetical protein
LFPAQPEVAFHPGGKDLFSSLIPYADVAMNRFRKMRSLIGMATLLGTFLAASADERSVLREVRLDPASTDIVGQFHQVGYPKYTDVEKQIIDRAQKMQDEHDAMFKRIEVGKSVFDYRGLIALGPIVTDPDGGNSYTLTIGIRPHLVEFSETFGEYQIEIDGKGIVRNKTKVTYIWKKS